jgi:hypothetical protein
MDDSPTARAIRAAGPYVKVGLAPLLVEALLVAGVEVGPPSFIESQLEELLGRLSDPLFQL